MTYSKNENTDKKTFDGGTTDVQGCTQKPWEDCVNGRNFKNDPERGNHLFDTRKVYRSKDDVHQLNYILMKLRDLGGDHKFDSDFKNNPNGKMRVTLHSGRKNRNTNKTFSPLHNDRNFESNPEHIARDKSGDNIIWNWCGSSYTFDEGELKFYEETFGAQLEYTNQRYIDSRHKERCRDMNHWRKEIMHAPEEQILQIGKMEKYPDEKISLSCFKEYIEWLGNWNDEHGKPFFILNWAMHIDEQGAPHFHLRKAWPYRDPKTGLITTDQTHSLMSAGILSPKPEMKITQKNNPKITFDKICREQWIRIARKHGLEIEDTPKPKNQVGKSLTRYQKEMDKWRNDSYRFMTMLAEKNIGIMEKIMEWEEIIPAIEKFENLVEDNCRKAQRTFSPGDLAEIVRSIVSVHAQDLKKIQNEKDCEIKKLDHELNGHDHWKDYVLRHQFGVKEINEMLTHATPEQLEKISEVMKSNGYEDLESWMKNTKEWFTQFPAGAKIKRELNKKNHGMGY